jgi:hypothetical protein
MKFHQKKRNKHESYEHAGLGEMQLYRKSGYSSHVGSETVAANETADRLEESNK